VADPEQAAYSDEVGALVESAMRGMQAGEKEAFILYGIEGFSVEETAAILDRPAEEVRNTIASARECVRKFPSLSQQFRHRRPPTSAA